MNGGYTDAADYDGVNDTFHSRGNVSYLTRHFYFTFVNSPVFEKRVNIDQIKMTPPKMINILDKTFVPFIPKEDIEARITELAALISKDYEESCPVFVVVLNGAFLFASELVKRIPLSCEISFIRLSSYVLTASTGKVREIIGLDRSLENRDIVIIEDIVDTGLTMNQLLKQIHGMSPKSVEIATLLHKPEALKTPVRMRYTGFEIANQFVVGYGLDYEGIGRNLDSIYVLA
jgi:hypoxanthine phosphoribosyltransferase